MKGNERKWKEIKGNERKWKENDFENLSQLSFRGLELYLEELKERGYYYHADIL